MALMETLQDNFDFGGIDTGKWSTWGAPVVNATTNLLLEMTSVLGGAYGGLLSLVTFDLTGSYAYSQLVDAGNQAITSLEVYPLELTTGNNALAIMINLNTVYARKKIAGSYTTVGSTVPYNASTMKWFRIRESGGTTYWEYAADPTSTWTIIASAANPITVTALTAGITIGTWQAESSTSTVKVDNFNTTPTQYQFSWKGQTWNKRIHQGAPSSNQQWDPANITIDSNGYVVLTLSNPTLLKAYGAEIFSVQRGFGYGTYMAVIGTELDTMDSRIGFGNLFTFDFTASPDYKEIDSAEIRNYNNNPNIRILHSHVYNNGGSPTFITDDKDMPSDSIHTHILRWYPTKIIYDAYKGTGQDNVNFFHTEQTTNLPTPGLERVHFNIWNNTGIAGYANVSPFSVSIRDFSFVPYGASLPDEPFSERKALQTKTGLTSNFSLHDLRTAYYGGLVSQNDAIRAFLQSQTSLTTIQSIGDLWRQYFIKKGVVNRVSLTDMADDFFTNIGF